MSDEDPNNTGIIFHEEGSFTYYETKHGTKEPLRFTITGSLQGVDKKIEDAWQEYRASKHSGLNNQRDPPVNTIGESSINFSPNSPNSKDNPQELAQLFHHSTRHSPPFISPRISPEPQDDYTPPNFQPRGLGMCSYVGLSLAAIFACAAAASLYFIFNPPASHPTLEAMVAQLSTATQSLHSVVHKSTPHLSTSTLWPSDTPNPPTITPIPPTYTPSPPTSTPIFPTAVILNTCSKIPVYNLENLTVHQVIEIMQWIPENVLKVFWKEGELTFLSRVDNTGDGKIDRSDVFYQQPPNSLIFLRILDLEKYSEEALHRSVADDNFLTWLKDPFGQGYNRAWYDEVCGDVQGSNLPAVAASPLQTITYHVSLNALAMLGAIVYSNPYVRIAMLGINQYHISKPYIYTKMKNIYNKITNFIRKSPKIELNPQLEHLLFHKMQLSRYN